MVSRGNATLTHVSTLRPRNGYKASRHPGLASMNENRTYFMRRAAQERSAATQAKGKARLAHQQMADHYRELVDQLEVTGETVPTA